VKIVGINGIHRRGKNTAIMLQAVLDEAAILGAETELLELTDYNIKFCLSCNKCRGSPSVLLLMMTMLLLGKNYLALTVLCLVHRSTGLM